MAHQQERGQILIQPDLVPDLFHVGSRLQNRFRLNRIFEVQNFGRHLSCLHGSLEGTRQDERWRDFGFNGSSQNQLELTASLARKSALGVRHTDTPVFRYPMTKQIEVHSGGKCNSVILILRMFVTKETQGRVLVAVAVLAASFIHVSIAASQVLLGIGIFLILLFRGNMRFPRIWVPLAALFLWTALADVLCPDPWAGRAQIKKFFVFLLLPLVFEVFSQQFAKVYYVVVGWTIAATASGVWSITQYLTRYRTATYQAYVGHRITGFESHWMTFSALQLSVLSVLLAHWFFSDRKLPRWAYLSVPILAVAIVLSGTRSIWLASVPAVLYLIWFWRPKMILTVPVLMTVIYFASPATTKERLRSLVQPKEDVDSNSHRVTTFRTGLQMIEAHPWFGIGPEQIRQQFDSYVPADIRRPLPVGYYGHLHNIYVQYAAERGIPGLILLLWIIAMFVWDSIAALRQLPAGLSQQRFVLHAAIAITIGILVGGIFEYNLGDSEVLMMFVTVMALGYAAIANTLRTQTIENEAFHQAVA